MRAHDPQGVREAKLLLPQSISYRDDIYDMFDGADCVVLMTEWNQYRGLDLKRVRGLMRGNAFVDLRNVYEPGAMHEAGFSYHCVGRS